MLADVCIYIYYTHSIGIQSAAYCPNAPKSQGAPTSNKCSNKLFNWMGCNSKSSQQWEKGIAWIWLEPNNVFGSLSLSLSLFIQNPPILLLSKVCPCWLVFLVCLPFFVCLIDMVGNLGRRLKRFLISLPTVILFTDILFLQRRKGIWNVKSGRYDNGNYFNQVTN